MGLTSGVQSCFLAVRTLWRGSCHHHPPLLYLYAQRVMTTYEYGSQSFFNSIMLHGEGTRTGSVGPIESCFKLINFRSSRDTSRCSFLLSLNVLHQRGGVKSLSTPGGFYCLGLSCFVFSLLLGVGYRKFWGVRCLEFLRLISTNNNNLLIELSLF